MESIEQILKQKIAKLSTEKVQHNYITQEYQDNGYRLAVRLNDLAHKALYIRFCKELPRALVEDAACFAADYPKAKNKGKIFMWKLTELLAEYKFKHPDFKFSVRTKKKQKSVTAKPKVITNRKKTQKQDLSNLNLQLV